MSSREFQAENQGKSSLISSSETRMVETVKGGVEGGFSTKNGLFGCKSRELQSNSSQQ